MILVATGTFIAFVITFFIMPFIIKIARINKLFDIPDERKTHTYPISSLGGVGIITGLAISLLLVSDFTIGNSEFQYYLACFFIIFILGVIDDIFVLHPLKKVFGQLVVASILTAKTHLLIANFEGLAGIFELSSSFSYLFTFFTIILVINSFNLIDGVDGLAGSLGLISSLAFGLFFFFNNNLPFAILGFTMSGSLLAFLCYNFPPAKIFMGDSGSMMIGLVNAILFTKFIQTGSTVTHFPVTSSIVIGFCFVIIPLLDVLRVFIIRLTKGVSPFAPDRNHLHHLLLNRGFSHTVVTVTLSAAALFFAGFGFFIQKLNINLAAIILVLVFFTGVFVIKYFARHAKHLHVVDAEELEIGLQDTKVLTLFRDKEKAVLKEE